jgi:Protein of unknown function (DUF3575)
MKKIFLLPFYLLLSWSATAQLDISIDPIGLGLKFYSVKIDYAVQPKFSVELEPIVVRSKFSFLGDNLYNKGMRYRCIGKYYANPKTKNDAWYYGGYLTFSDIRRTTFNGTLLSVDKQYTRLALGGLGGYKWKFDNRIIMDMNLGLGRYLSKKEVIYPVANPRPENASAALLALKDFNVVMQLSVGYRF